MPYKDMVIEASEAERVRTPDKKRVGRFKVRVLHSLAGEMKPEEAVQVEYDYRQFQANLKRLESRELDQAGLVDLGRALALLLLPPGEEGSPSNVRSLFADSLRAVGQDGGLRLRLRLPPALAVVPWEYMYVDRAGGGDGMDGFLILDPRVAQDRHAALLAPAPLSSGTAQEVTSALIEVC